jgi:hypothetical protein
MRGDGEFGRDDREKMRFVTGTTLGPSRAILQEGTLNVSPG